MSSQEKATAYWKENLRYLLILLSIWFLSSYGAGILFAEQLNAIQNWWISIRILVCATRINLRFCHLNFCLCSFDEQIR
jgi:uncharacterized membrane protein